MQLNVDPLACFVAIDILVATIIAVTWSNIRNKLSKQSKAKQISIGGFEGSHPPVSTLSQ